MDVTADILAEIYRAAERLGARSGQLRSLTAAGLYDELEALGADRRLLGVVGSWGDCMTDAEVLSALRQWNATGRLGFDVLYASTSEP